MRELGPGTSALDIVQGDELTVEALEHLVDVGVADDPLDLDEPLVDLDPPVLPLGLLPQVLAKARTCGRRRGLVLVRAPCR
jgi:hypothetical protein